MKLRGEIALLSVDAHAEVSNVSKEAGAPHFGRGNHTHSTANALYNNFWLYYNNCRLLFHFSTYFLMFHGMSQNSFAASNLV